MAVKVITEREWGISQSNAPLLAGYEVTGPTVKRLGRGIVAMYSFGIEIYRRHKEKDLVQPQIVDAKLLRTIDNELYEALFPRQ